jgi:hypothetical protein
MVIVATSVFDSCRCRCRQNYDSSGWWSHCFEGQTLQTKTDISIKSLSLLGHTKSVFNSAALHHEIPMKSRYIDD